MASNHSLRWIYSACFCSGLLPNFEITTDSYVQVPEKQCPLGRSYKSSAVAEMDDRLATVATMDMGRYITFILLLVFFGQNIL